MRRGVETGHHPEEGNSELANLWRRFHLDGKPPKAGTVAEQRLMDKCQFYSNLLLDPNKTSATGSDSYRRQLHNEIAIMVTGKERSGMAFDDANNIAEFAVKLSTGMSIEEAAEMFSK